MKKYAQILLLSLALMGCNDETHTADNYTICMNNCKTFGNDYEYCKQDCGNNAANNQNNQNNNGSSSIFDELKKKGELTAAEMNEIRADCAEEGERCVAQQAALAKVFKSVGCNYNDEELEAARCVDANIRANYRDAIVNSKEYLAYISQRNRYHKCCELWDDEAECEDDERDEYYDKWIVFLFNIFLEKCTVDVVDLWECEGKLSCNQVAHSEDHAYIGICWNADSPYYQGSSYCDSSLTYYCKSQHNKWGDCYDRNYDNI